MTENPFWAYRPALGDVLTLAIDSKEGISWPNDRGRISQRLIELKGQFPAVLCSVIPDGTSLDQITQEVNTWYAKQIAGSFLVIGEDRIVVNKVSAGSTKGQRAMYLHASVKETGVNTLSELAEALAQNS